MRRNQQKAIGMLILKRLSVWALETALQALLLSLVLIGLFGYDSHEFGKTLLICTTWIVIMFFSTGYLFSTVLFRAFWRGRGLWLYSAIATLLFLIHFEILNVGVGVGGAFNPPERLRIRAAGVCIVFACTFVGSYFLRKGSSPQQANGAKAALNTAAY
jgi:hypothetical protein